jgi:alanine racemase
MSDRTQAVIDIAAIHHNLTIIQQQAPASQILAMVKSNAYGHGLVAISKVLTEVGGFGVACLDEALQLRNAGVSAPIVLMSGVFTPQDLALVQQYQLQIVVHDPFQIALIDTCDIKMPLHVWLKIDTGMHRLGFHPAQITKMYDFLANSSKIAKPIVIMTHLADADNVNKETTAQQVAVFNNATSFLTGLKSIANSAGIIAWPQTIAHWNRPGIMIYGISPMLGKIGADHGLQATMTLKSKIIAIHDLHRGDAIGYGGTWTCPEPMRVAAVAIGYGDGYPRHAKNGTPTLIKGQLCPLVGRVSMDIIMVDLRDCFDAAVGDDVILWGDGLPVEIVANYADTIAYELMCNLSQRVVFLYQ